MPRRSQPIDMAGATELKLTIDNDGELYRRRALPIHKNLALKKSKGTFDSAKAVKAFLHLADAGAAQYKKEFGTVFNRATRLEVARLLLKDWLEDN